MRAAEGESQNNHGAQRELLDTLEGGAAEDQGWGGLDGDGSAARRAGYTVDVAWPWAGEQAGGRADRRGLPRCLLADAVDAIAHAGVENAIVAWRLAAGTWHLALHACPILLSLCTLHVGAGTEP